MGKLKKSFIISFFVLFTLLAVLMAILSLYSLFFNIKNRSVSEESLEKNVGAFTGETVLAQSNDMGQQYIDKIVFLGESTTYGLQRYGVLSDGSATNQVWTGATFSGGKPISAGTLSLSPSIANTKIFFPDTCEALTIGQAVARKNPDILIITLGLNNGASYYSESEFKNSYRLLLDSVFSQKCSTRVILQSLFPVTDTCVIKAYTPHRIAECNGWIYDIAEEYGIKYLNTNECLSDGNGYLKPEYENGGDGIHLNALGLNKVLEYIRTHGIEEKI